MGCEDIGGDQSVPLFLRYLRDSGKDVYRLHLLAGQNFAEGKFRR